MVVTLFCSVPGVGTGGSGFLLEGLINTFVEAEGMLNEGLVMIVLVV